MNPSSKGWLKIFINYAFQNNKLVRSLKDKSENLNDEKYLYRLIQTTGLIYGTPSQFFVFDNTKSREWNNKEKIKLIIIESFISYQLYRDKGSETDINVNIDNYIRVISDFYTLVFPEISHSIGTKDKFEFVEKVIDKRINIKYNVVSGFWTSMFQNSLIFLDLVYFARYMNENHITTVEEKEKTKLIIVQIIAAAAHSNHHINKEEKRLFEYFLLSAHLTPANKKLAKEYFKTGITIDTIDISATTSWIIKKFCFEIASLTIWSDREVDNVEIEFLEKLAKYLNFSESDKESSMLAVESFILNNTEQVIFLANKRNYQLISKSMHERLTKMLLKNKSMLMQEISESKELVELLSKSSMHKLTKEEKKKVKSQLLDILKTIPSFAIFMVPGGSILLPFILKIIPENLMKPSSFTNQSDKS